MKEFKFEDQVGEILKNTKQDTYHVSAGTILQFGDNSAPPSPSNPGEEIQSVFIDNKDLEKIKKGEEVAISAGKRVTPFYVGQMIELLPDEDKGDALKGKITKIEIGKKKNNFTLTVTLYTESKEVPIK
jgi:hypothetical protein